MSTVEVGAIRFAGGPKNEVSTVLGMMIVFIALLSNSRLQ